MNSAIRRFGIVLRRLILLVVLVKSSVDEKEVEVFTVEKKPLYCNAIKVSLFTSGRLISTDS